MNTVHASGAASGTCPLLSRRSITLLVLVCSLLCFTAGGLFLPRQAHAASHQAVTPSVKRTPAKTPKKTAAQKRRARTPYVRSLTSADERRELLERGISSGFGVRAISRKRTRMHKGIDIPGPKDSKVLAYNDGEVIFTGVKNGYGKTVVVRQLDGRDALYAHMNKYVVAVGDKVKRGDHIGHVGRTGRATGYHLHFEIIDDGKNLDPALHVWHGSELVLGPNDFDPSANGQTRVAEPSKRTQIPLF